MPERFFIQTYGCQMNVYEAGVVRRILADAGLAETHSEQDADVLLMMTCSVREHAERRALGRLGAFRALKAARPDRVIAVLGCMAQNLGEKLIEEHGADLVVGPDEYRGLPAAIRALRSGSPTMQVAARLSSECYDDVPPRPDGSPTAFVTVMRGCDNFCSYCIVPLVKGRERSRPVSGIIAEVEALAGQGVKEVTLLGQNVLAYSSNGVNFPGLLGRVAAVKGIERIRFLTSHPRDVTPELCRAIEDIPAVCPALHLPVQSGSDRILELMNRGYTRADYLEKVAMLRDSVSDFSLTTDIMVGFPGETEAEFQETLSLVREVRFDEAWMFRFSARPGTRAAELAADPRCDAGRRLAELIKVQNEITRQSCQAMVGAKFELLVEGPSPQGNGMLGRTRSGRAVVLLDDARIGDTVLAGVTDLKGRTPVAVRAELKMDWQAAEEA
ncbi:MAG: tRNA (N6-isopentenyl adenosine(37)-C2)-methylthiotransferase MiaB [candidate division WOR-3 bacterium]